MLYVVCGCGGRDAFSDAGGQAGNTTIQRNCVAEIRLRPETDYPDPYNDITLDVLFDGPGNISLLVPAFWMGADTWCVRFAAEQTGCYNFRSVCSNPQDKGLHDITGTISVIPYTGGNPLFKHGRLRVAKDKNHFVHADGTDFFWIGDTWWMGLTERLKWPDDFKWLTADRVNKGFNLIQIVAGPLPDMDSWDRRGTNEGGFPFEKDFAGINPAFYNHADHKIKHLVESGLMPCIVGMWGYHLPKMGTEKAKKYWRYIVARYGAYPVVWCVAGESTMPYYLSTNKKRDRQLQQAAWCEVASYVRTIDAYHNLLSVHPATNARDMCNSGGPFDFEMLQTGHSGRDSIPNTVRQVRKAVMRRPTMPVVNSEVNYEGILGRSWQDIQRLSFYVSVFNGTAGHTYGANGIWQLNAQDRPYGPSPHGRAWGNMPWKEAAKLAGGAQVALGAKFISQFEWFRFEPHDDWIESERDATDPEAVRCMGIPRRLRLVYVPLLRKAPTIKAIEPDVRYHAYYFDPCTGSRHELGLVEPDENGTWPPPPPVEFQDWIIVLEASDQARHKSTGR